MSTNTLQGAIQYNPAKVMLNQGSGTMPASQSPYVVKAQSIRSTGQGPFDSAYRQNLASYAGGQFTRPGGNLSFNPTSNVQNWGSPSGGGNAPNVGLPTTLLQQALGSNAYAQPQSTAPSAPATSPSTSAPTSPTPIQNWLEQFMQNGSNYGGASL